MKYISVGLVLLVVACAQPAANVKLAPAEYSIPAEQGESEYSRIFDKSYDDVWHSVIAHVRLSLSESVHVEKNMGLITFTHYEKGDWGDSSYVYCTELKGYQTGDDVEYAEGQLVAVVNIYVQEIAENKTSLKAVVLYTYSAIARIRPESFRAHWIFKTFNFNEAAGRRCRPTYDLEKSILDAASSD